MNVRTLLRNVHTKPWLIEPTVALQLLDQWERITSSGAKWDYDAKEDTPKKFFESKDVQFAPETSWAMREFKGFDSPVAVIVMSGPLMKEDNCGALGTAAIRSLVAMANKSAIVKQIVMLIDSPGGTVDGTESLGQELLNCEKDTIALCDGYMCSAAYWIGSCCDKVYASSRTDFIGSIGTMCSWYDNSKALEARGIVLREFYATASTDKNRAFAEAEKGNGKLLIEEHLDPLNDVFLSTVKENRKKLSEEALTGKTYDAQKAQEVGLIDGIKTLSEIIEQANKSTTITYTSSIMTAQELKTSHSAVYQEILLEGKTQGATAERERVAAWQEWADVDAEAVTAGITGGKEITRAEVSAFSKKAAQQAALGAAKQENAPDVTPNASAADKAKTEEEKVFEANQAEVLRILKGR